jgi:hypothetical protein
MSAPAPVQTPQKAQAETPKPPPNPTNIPGSNTTAPNTTSSAIAKADGKGSSAVMAQAAPIAPALPAVPAVSMTQAALKTGQAPPAANIPTSPQNTQPTQTVPSPTTVTLKPSATNSPTVLSKTQNEKELLPPRAAAHAQDSHAPPVLQKTQYASEGRLPAQKIPKSLVTESPAVLKKTQYDVQETRSIPMVTPNSKSPTLRKEYHRDVSMQTPVKESITTSSEESVTVLGTVVPAVRNKLHKELEIEAEKPFARGVAAEVLLDFIAAERLRRMPHRGSTWDNVLKRAEFFTSQVSTFHQQMARFTAHSTDASQLIYASSLMLLQLGPTQAVALDVAFNIFYKLGLSLSFLLRLHGLFRVAAEISQELGRAYADVVHIVTDVAIT